MATPAGIGPLALTDLPDPCLLGSGNDVAAYGLAARLLTPPDAPAEWNEPKPVACIDLRAALGSRLDQQGIADWERKANEVLGQDTRCTSVTATLTFSGGELFCSIQAVGAEGPFSFVFPVNDETAALLRGS